MIEFISKYYQVISTCFGFCAALYLGVRLFKDVFSAYRSVIEVSQRHDFQAGYFDVQEKRYDTLLDKHSVLERDISALKANIIVLKSKS